MAREHGQPLRPVSNLTNPLAADRIGPHAFAARRWAPQLAAVVVTVVFLWVLLAARPGPVLATAAGPAGRPRADAVLAAGRRVPDVRVDSPGRGAVAVAVTASTLSLDV